MIKDFMLRFSLLAALLFILAGTASADKKQNNMGCHAMTVNTEIVADMDKPCTEEADSTEEQVQRTSPREELAFYYHTDHLGSTNLVTDHGRSICHAAEYLPYGEVFVDLQTSGSDPDLPFKFNGKEMDPETGMLYYGARYYMPKYCQWPTCDPMELKYPGVSSYAFCKNNPLFYVDNDGKKLRFGQRAQKDKTYQMNFAAAVQILNRAKVGYILAKLEALDAIIYLEPIPKAKRLESYGAYYDSKKNTIYWDYDENMTTNVEGVFLSPMTILNHEADHALDDNKSSESAALLKERMETPDSQYKNKAEKKTIQGIEQITAKALGEIKEGQVTRTDHEGKSVFGVTCIDYLTE